jgi:CheY-like chemotaxis protein
MQRCPVEVHQVTTPRAATSQAPAGPQERPPRPRVLCVDDEVAVLEGLRLNLHRAFDCVSASGGAEGLALVERGPAFAVILSDMRMPGMDGATFLARARELAPDTVRVLLTGHADVESAMAAVNQGQIFRFLTKPCPPDQVRATLEQAAQQHRLATAERELLEQTLTGAVKALTDLLALASPTVFGRASRLRRTVSGLCVALHLRDRWAIEVAAELSQIGFVALSPAVAEKCSEGQELTPAEQAQVDRALQLADQLLAHIPRLEPVREILTAVAGASVQPPAGLPMGARLLTMAMELDTLESSGLRPAEALAALLARPGYEASLVSALRAVVEERTAATIRSIALAELRPGMVLAEDVRSRAGVLLVARGYTASSGMVAKLHNLGPSVQEPITVVMAAASR